MRERIKKDISDAYKIKNFDEFIKLEEDEINRRTKAHVDSILTNNYVILHEPDQVAGGEAIISHLYNDKDITDEVNLKASKLIGTRGANSSIGSQWAKQGRIQGLDKHVKDELDKIDSHNRGNKIMNVELKRI